MSLRNETTVLIIGTMTDASELTSTHLEKHNLNTVYEQKPQEAIENHNLQDPKTEIDCIVCDYDMPQLNGLEVLDNIRTSNPRIPFILYTGKGDEEIASKSITMGVTDYIQKDSGENHYSLLANRVKNAIQMYRSETAQRRSVEKDTLREIKGIFNQEENLEEKQNALLRLGTEYLEMPAGFVSHISDTHLTLLDTIGLDNVSDDIKQCPLEETYCKNTIERSKPLMVSNAKDSSEIDDEAYQQWNIDSYIGSKIIVDGEVYGTICFIDSGNEHSFDEAHEVFIDLLAQWLGYEISNERVQNRLSSQRDNLEEFTALVRHDLKNPLTVAMGHIDMLREDIGENTHLNKIEKSTNRIDELLDDFSFLSKTVGELDSDDLEPIDVYNTARQVWADSVPEGEGELIVADTQERQLICNNGLFRQIIQNLFRNAVEHNEGNIEVKITRTAEGVIIEDNGTGIPEDAGDVFEKGITTSENNTGYGLYITKKIIEVHGWSVSLESDDSGAKFIINTLMETN